MPANVSEVLILSTGGTFNKIYDPLSGMLEVDGGGKALEAVAERWLCTLKYRELVGKDSLEMEESDREEILEAIRKADEQRIVIIHGTDTMEITAKYLAERHAEKRIVLTGAMVPWSIDPVEATANLALSLGFILGGSEPGIYIGMNGRIGPWNTLTKNREAGRFQSAEGF